jgi:hypothetical protein
MSINEAHTVKQWLEEYETFKTLPDKIIRLHRDGDHDKVCNIACELATELEHLWESKIYQIKAEMAA